MTMNIIFMYKQNMKINNLEMKILICRRVETTKLQTKLDNDILEVLDKYKYLENIVTNSRRYNQEIKYRLQQALCAISKE